MIHPAVVRQVERWHIATSPTRTPFFEHHEQKLVTRIAGIDAYARISWCGIPIIESQEINENVILPYTQEDERVMRKYDVLLSGILTTNIRRQVREQFSRMVR